MVSGPIDIMMSMVVVFPFSLLWMFSFFSELGRVRPSPSHVFLRYIHHRPNIERLDATGLEPPITLQQTSIFPQNGSSKQARKQEERWNKIWETVTAVFMLPVQKPATTVLPVL